MYGILGWVKLKLYSMYALIIIGDGTRSLCDSLLITVLVLYSLSLSTLPQRGKSSQSDVRNGIGKKEMPRASAGKPHVGRGGG
jgi:hypothetical protein